MDDINKIKEDARNIFTEYLNARKHRKTPERFAILEHIYSTKGHFDIEVLYRAMNDDNHFRVSRATLYNTIDLLIDCGLLVKHQFGTNISQYERTYGNESHDHLICINCGKVKEYKGGEVFVPAHRKRQLRFKITYYSTYIYGTCSKCQRAKMKEAEKKKPKEKNDIKTLVNKSKSYNKK
jgi:Fur family ferric uptake transcriptional regulator